jgi:hypothetical protein
MSRTAHRIYIAALVSIVVFTVIYFTLKGTSYYSTPLGERFFHPDHTLLKPSGFIGHGLGIIGSMSIIIGVFSYMARKRFRFLSRLGLIKHWLEFHIFLCALGPILILFHSSFKFGGLVAVSFWSMVAVVASGIIGRFIYLQIPRSIEGRELSLSEVKGMKTNLGVVLQETYDLDKESLNIIMDTALDKRDKKDKHWVGHIFQNIISNYQINRRVKHVIKSKKFSRKEYKRILRLIKNEITLNKKIERLHSMQRLFKYWHVAHLPFAMIMLIIMLVHVGVSALFGYTWIF